MEGGSSGLLPGRRWQGMLLLSTSFQLGLRLFHQARHELCPPGQHHPSPRIESGQPSVSLAQPASLACRECPGYFQGSSQSLSTPPTRKSSSSSFPALSACAWGPVSPGRIESSSSEAPSRRL